MLFIRRISGYYIHFYLDLKILTSPSHWLRIRNIQAHASYHHVRSISVRFCNESLDHSRPRIDRTYSLSCSPVEDARAAPLHPTNHNTTRSRSRHGRIRTNYPCRWRLTWLHSCICLDSGFYIYVSGSNPCSSTTMMLNHNMARPTCWWPSMTWWDASPAVLAPASCHCSFVETWLPYSFLLCNFVIFLFDSFFLSGIDLLNKLLPGPVPSYHRTIILFCRPGPDWKKFPLCSCIARDLKPLSDQAREPSKPKRTWINFPVTRMGAHKSKFSQFFSKSLRFY